jgi:DNA-binding NarL/FixJ family response regulator
MKKPDIIIVDDHKIFRKGLKTIVNIENIGTVIGEASNGIEFIDLLKQLKPDLVLMDIDMPGMDGLEATQKAIEIIPDIKIIALTMFGDEEYFLKMIDLGVKGYILKSSELSELEKAIHLIMKGEKYFSNHQFSKNNSKPENKKMSESQVYSQKYKTTEDIQPPWF